MENTKIILFFVDPLQKFFNDNLFFKFINKCQKKYWGSVSHFLHMCVIFENVNKRHLKMVNVNY